MTDLPIISHWIGGAILDGDSTRTSPVFNPATGRVARNVRLASIADVNDAVAVALAAFLAWRDTSQAKRHTIMHNFRELLNARKEDLADIPTAEHGKVTADALGEITRGLEVVEFALGMPQLSKGDYSENVSTGVDVTR
jgi:malonate-semialdehyde dehydrogenase (acetylating)/methylmalonate-semialdehyde dehydrogenase